MYQVQQSALLKAKKKESYDAVFLRAIVLESPGVEITSSASSMGPSFEMVSGLPWGMCLGHPHKVHVAGQQGEVRHGLGVVRTAEVTVGQQDVDDQLQVGLPSNGLPE